MSAFLRSVAPVSSVIMTSFSDTIVITDDEELPNPSIRSDSYAHIERTFEALAWQADMMTSHKRRRRKEDGPPAIVRILAINSSLSFFFLNLIINQENIFEEFRKAVTHAIQQLQNENQILQDELRREKKSHEQTQEELSEERKKQMCKICYQQPDSWMMFLCGHMVCCSCTERLERRKCPICQTRVRGNVECYPFAG